MPRYSLNARVQWVLGQTGSVKRVYGSPGWIICVVECDSDGRLLEKFEEELTPLEGSLTASE